SSMLSTMVDSFPGARPGLSVHTQGSKRRAAQETPILRGGTPEEGSRSAPPRARLPRPDSPKNKGAPKKKGATHSTGRASFSIALCS
ncbi:MAG TPA: hypothetical protein RMF84_14830, partial [Polyangiaceae bacterium LLY-WYZ-14_1]|nr:hypothetical protein [Polyangiaceae bacterium LLY-WYZ-14_1]